jgi:hypothetical protein
VHARKFLMCHVALIAFSHGRYGVADNPNNYIRSWRLSHKLHQGFSSKEGMGSQPDSLLTKLSLGI